MNIKDVLLLIMKDHNEGKELDEIITRLYYKDQYVEDFSPFANENYMSSKLLEFLKNGTTLSSGLKNELSEFVVSKKVELSLN